MSNKKCKKCGTIFSSLHIKCPNCGAALTDIKLILAIILLISIVILYKSILFPRYISTNYTKIQKEKKPSEIFNNYPTEYMLAVIDNSYVRPDDIIINRYKYLLKSIDKKTKESYTQIGDMTVSTQSQIQERIGKTITLLKILEDINYMIPEDFYKSSYADMTALYILAYIK